ncbi:hypothetical protein CI610_02167 [invertebrate metagenome]|uniref:Uncharacterized protein n=1 Tax=invertebrate metagenome TaxID=1711999 RepID=A0A2H9T6Q6_9ZZZZ
MTKLSFCVSPLLLFTFTVQAYFIQNPDKPDGRHYLYAKNKSTLKARKGQQIEFNYFYRPEELALFPFSGINGNCISDARDDKQSTKGYSVTDITAIKMTSSWVSVETDAHHWMTGCHGKTESFKPPAILLPIGQTWWYSPHFGKTAYLIQTSHKTGRFVFLQFLLRIYEPDTLSSEQPKVSNRNTPVVFSPQPSEDQKLGKKAYQSWNAHTITVLLSETDESNQGKPKTWDRDLKLIKTHYLYSHYQEADSITTVPEIIQSEPEKMLTSSPAHSPLSVTGRKQQVKMSTEQTSNRYPQRARKPIQYNDFSISDSD